MFRILREKLNEAGYGDWSPGNIFLVAILVGSLAILATWVLWPVMLLLVIMAVPAFIVGYLILMLVSLIKIWME